MPPEGFDVVQAHEWPKGDTLLPRLLQRQINGELVELLNPILHETSLPRPEQGFADGLPQGYMNWAQKVLMREFVTTDRTTALGAAVFTKDAVGLRGDADPGAIASMLDNVLGVYSFAVKEHTTVTRSFEMTVSKPVPLSVAIEFRCRVARDVGRRLLLEADMLDPFDGSTSCVAVAEFASFGIGHQFYMPFLFSNCGGFGHVVAMAMAQPRQARQVPNRHREWPPLGKSLTRWLLSEGFRRDRAYATGVNDSAIQLFDFGMAPKLRMQPFHSSDGKTMCAVLHFSPLTAGPPGGANGGSVLCSMVTAALHLLGDAYVLGDISTEFRRLTPLGAIACLTCKRGHVDNDGCVVVKMELAVMNGTDGMNFREDTRPWDPAKVSVVATSSATARSLPATPSRL